MLRGAAATRPAGFRALKERRAKSVTAMFKTPHRLAPSQSGSSENGVNTMAKVGE